MNRAIDYAPKRFVLMEITDDGPSRIQGNTTYSTFGAARHAAEAFLRANKHKEVTVFQVLYRYWLDPKPQMLTNEDLPADGA